MKSLILSRQIRLLDSIGCGQLWHTKLINAYCRYFYCVLSCILTGEFGVVYKGHLFVNSDPVPKIVAVKTLKGNAAGNTCLHIYICPMNTLEALCLYTIWMYSADCMCGYVKFSWCGSSRGGLMAQWLRFSPCGPWSWVQVPLGADLFHS